MRTSTRLAKIFFLLGASAAFWLDAGQPARAGGGGADLADVQNVINDFCTFLGVSKSNCPQLPTISQAVLELAALYDQPPEAVRSAKGISVWPYIDAGNPSRPPAGACTLSPCTDPLKSVTLPINLSLPIDPSGPSLLSTLRPLAFISATKSDGTATPTQLYDRDANIFFYAVGGRSASSSVDALEPDTLLLFYENLQRDNHIFQPGRVVAKISLPLTVLDSDGMTERTVSAALQFRAPTKNAAPCSASTIVGDFAGTGTQQSVTPPTTIGVDCAVAFGATPMSSHPHAVFEVSVPLLITSTTDPLIVDNPNNIVPGTFPNNLTGFKPSNCPGSNCVLGYTMSGPNGQSIGIAPSAGPLGLAVTASSPPATYSLCANLPTKNPFAPPVPAVAAFYAIAGNGEVFLSAPLAPTPPGIVCPAM